jgi:hypothetical protein
MAQAPASVGMVDDPLYMILEADARKFWEIPGMDKN